MVRNTRICPSLPARAETGRAQGNLWKGAYFGGSVGLTGAAALTAAAAVRTGSGLVSLSVPPEIWPVLAVKCQEAMPAPVARFEILLENMNQCNGVLIGPGLGRSRKTDVRICHLVERLQTPLVLDADGINAVGRTYRCSGHQAWPSDGPDPSRWGISPAESGEGHWPVVRPALWRLPVSTAACWC